MLIINVIEICNKYGMARVFTGIWLFHHERTIRREGIKSWGLG